MCPCQHGDCQVLYWYASNINSRCCLCVEGPSNNINFGSEFIIIMVRVICAIKNVNKWWAFKFNQYYVDPHTHSHMPPPRTHTQCCSTSCELEGMAYSTNFLWPNNADSERTSSPGVTTSTHKVSNRITPHLGSWPHCYSPKQTVPLYCPQQRPRSFNNGQNLVLPKVSVIYR